MLRIRGRVCVPKTQGKLFELRSMRKVNQGTVAVKIGEFKFEVQLRLTGWAAETSVYALGVAQRGGRFVPTGACKIVHGIRNRESDRSR